MRWPNQRGSVGVAPPGESSRTSSSGLRPKRPAPTKPPANKGLPRQQKEREQGLVISNMAARSQEEVETERDLVPKATALSQDAGSRAIMKSTKREETVSKSHKSILHREELGSSKEPLLEGSRSPSAEESGVPEVVPLQVVPPPPPPPQAQEEVDSGSAATAEQKKKKRRKSAEIKYEGEATKHRSKSKHKKKSEYKKEVVKGSEETQGRNQTAFKMTEPSVEEGELPLPQEIAEAAADEALMIGAAGVGEGEEEFILDPPSKFSQSSVDYLDDFGDIDESGALSIDFAPPTAPSDDELEDELHPPPPPISHGNKTPPHNNPPISKTVSSEVKKKKGNLKAGKTVAAASKKRGGAPTEFPSMKEEWKGLDYPVRHSPWSRSSQEETGHANLAFPLDNRENQFTHRDALEEEEDDESRVVLDEDVAALLW